MKIWVHLQIEYPNLCKLSHTYTMIVKLVPDKMTFGFHNFLSKEAD